jgi:hypothetical protein
VAAVAAAQRVVTRHDIADYARSIMAAARALPDAGLIRRRFRAAGIVVAARFSDAALADLYLSRIACTELAEDGTTADSHVDVLSCDRLGWPPPAHWGDDDCPRQDFEAGLSAAGLAAAFPYHGGLWQVFDPADGYGVQLAATRQSLPPWDPGAPLRLHLFWALGQRGHRLVHAGTLGLGGVGVLLIGPGGAGKSGTTMAGLAAGLQSVGDDYVVLQTDPCAAVPLFRVAKLDPKGLARLGPLGDRLRGQPVNWQGKIEFDPALLFPAAGADRIHLRAILLPRIAGAERTTFVTVSPPEAMRALAFANLYQIPAGLESSFRFLGSLTRSLAAYELRLSTDVAEIGQALRQFIRTLAQR